MITRLTVMTNLNDDVYEVGRSIQSTEENIEHSRKFGTVREINNDNFDNCWDIVFENGNVISLENVPVKVEYE